MTDFSAFGITAADVVANRPNATAIGIGTLFYATDDQVIYRSNGSTWDTWIDLNSLSGSSGDVFGPTGPRTAPPTADWTWFQQLGNTAPTVSSRDGSMFFKAGPRGDHKPTARMRAAPSTPYTIIAHIRGVVASANYMSFGLCFGNAGSEIYCLYCGWVDGNMNVYVVPTTSGAMGAAAFGPLSMNHNMPHFFAIRDDGTNRKYYIGIEEENMWEIWSEARTTLFTATEVGFWAAPRQNTHTMRVTLWSWKEQTAAPNV